VSAWLIPAFGWRAVFYFGGVTPLVIAAFMFVGLPESLQFLVLRKGDRQNVARWLRRIDPDVAVGPEVEFVVREKTSGRSRPSSCSAKGGRPPRCCCG
jgi:AAHS family 4-hydroxybenzoate transporter-like MFS transporter